MNTRSTHALLTTGLLAAILCGSLAKGDVLTFNPTDDTYISMRSPDSNYGSSSQMVVENKYGASSDDWAKDALVRFDVSSIAAGTKVVSATLYLYYYDWHDNDPAGRELTCYRVASNWDEDSVTWNTQPTSAPQASSRATVPSSFGWMTWDVTGDVQAFVNGPGTEFGWKIVDEDPWQAANIPWTKFRSKEYGECIPYLLVVTEGWDVFVETLSNDSNIVANCVIGTQDGGSVVTGYTGSGGGTGKYLFLAKFDAQGNAVWNPGIKVCGPANAEGRCVVETHDGNFVAVGFREHEETGRDWLLKKYSSSGDHLWTRTWEGERSEEAHGVIEASDGTLWVTGFTNSFSPWPYEDRKQVVLARVASDGNSITGVYAGNPALLRDYSGFALAEVFGSHPGFCRYRRSERPGDRPGHAAGKVQPRLGVVVGRSDRRGRQG